MTNEHGIEVRGAQLSDPTKAGQPDSGNEFTEFKPGPAPPVETNNGGVYSQILYSPVGRTAVMSGLTNVTNAELPMPGGQSMWMNGSGGSNLKLVNHPDWLGSVRLQTTLVTGNANFDAAYTPYGELYDVLTGSTTRQNFTGDHQDLFAGLFDTPARELDQASGSRWLSPDQAHASWNAYAYPTNPNTATDPTGLGPPRPCPGTCPPGGNPWFGPVSPFDYVPLADWNAGFGNDSWLNTYTNDAYYYYGPAVFVTGFIISGAGVPVTSVASIDDDGTVTYSPSQDYTIRGSLFGWYTTPEAANNGWDYGTFLGWDANAWRAFRSSLFSWKNFSAGFKEGGCFSQFAEEAFDPADAMGMQDQAIKATAQSGAYVAATAYAANQGLVVPMRSSIVRGILDFGETLGESVALGATVYSEGKALVNEVKSFQSGQCQ